MKRDLNFIRKMVLAIEDDRSDTCVLVQGQAHAGS